jgi:hypothetical protein
MKQELLNTLKSKGLEEINNFLPGSDYIRRYSGNIDGCYTSGYYDDIMIIKKEGLTLTFKINKDYFEESEELFETTQEFEEGMEFEDWNGEWKKTLNKYSSVILLTYLLKL